MVDPTGGPTTLEEFIEDAEQFYREQRLIDPDQRRGQAYFNRLWHWWAPIAEEVRGTPVDPFHDDSRVNSFLATIRPYFE